jgi:hypothetical protein
MRFQDLRFPLKSSGIEFGNKIASVKTFFANLQPAMSVRLIFGLYSIIHPFLVLDKGGKNTFEREFLFIEIGRCLLSHLEKVVAGLGYGTRCILGLIRGPRFGGLAVQRVVDWRQRHLWDYVARYN